MQPDKIHLRKLCNAEEVTLLEKSMSPRLEKLSARELKQVIQRMRKLRDKNRDLFRRQTLETRRAEGGGKDPERNARTSEKAEVFDTALKAFESRLAMIDTVDKTEKKKLKSFGFFSDRDLRPGTQDRRDGR